MTQLQEPSHRTNASQEGVEEADKLTAMLSELPAARVAENNDVFTTIDMDDALRKQELMHADAIASINLIYDGATNNLNRIQDSYVQQRDAILAGEGNSDETTGENASEETGSETSETSKPGHDEAPVPADATRSGGRHRAYEQKESDDTAQRTGNLPAVPDTAHRTNGVLPPVPKTIRAAANRTVQEEDDAVRILNRTRVPAVPQSPFRTRANAPLRSLPTPRRGTSPQPDNGKRAVFGGPWAYEPEPGSAEARAMSKWGRAALIEGDDGANSLDQYKERNGLKGLQESAKHLGRLTMRGIRHLGRGAVAAGNAQVPGYSNSIVQASREQQPPEVLHVPIVDQSADQRVPLAVPSPREQGMGLDQVTAVAARNTRL